MDDRYLWEQPGAFDVAPGVHRIPLPLPGDALRAVNIYAIADGDTVVLIDGGWALAESEQLLEKSLATIGYELGDVREFLVTHMHRDHYTQAVAIRRRFGSTVSLGEGEQASFAAMRSVAEHPDAGHLRAAGAQELAALAAKWTGTPDSIDWDEPDRWLDDGVELPLQTRTLRVIATPGHTTGHVVFHDPAHGALFAGDHVLPHITPSIGVEPVRPPSPLRNYLSSLELIRRLPDARLLPAHGPVTGSVHDRIDELLAHHETRLTDTAATIDHGSATAFEAAVALPWTRHKRRFSELDTFNRMLAVHETMAHLIVLVERGWLTRTTGADGVTRFARA
jgi:glyoxylase-like metal-dependent hydrolase (beta-lactamase superfamily II)